MIRIVAARAVAMYANSTGVDTLIIIVTKYRIITTDYMFVRHNRRKAVDQFNSVDFSTYHLIQHTGCPSVSHDYA
jgi:hypothetical protein